MKKPTSFGKIGALRAAHDLAVRESERWNHSADVRQNSSHKGLASPESVQSTRDIGSSWLRIAFVLKEMINEIKRPKEINSEEEIIKRLREES